MGDEAIPRIRQSRDCFGPDDGPRNDTGRDVKEQCNKPFRERRQAGLETRTAGQRCQNVSLAAIKISAILARSDRRTGTWTDLAQAHGPKVRDEDTAPLGHS